MQNTTRENDRYCFRLARDGNRALFLRCLFLPEPARCAMLAVAALDTELAHVKHAVSEELLGHMRHAWWCESLAELAQTGKARAHPVLLALAATDLPREPLLKLAQAYGDAYPAVPENAAAMVESLAPADAPGWKKAGNIIAEHHKKHGDARPNRLLARLFLASLF